MIQTPANLLIARFPFDAQEAPYSVNWFIETVLRADTDPRFSVVQSIIVDEGPENSRLPMHVRRNFAVKTALDNDFDILVMLDQYTAPDVVPDKPPFWDKSLELLINTTEPSVVVAPYLVSWEDSSVYVKDSNNCEIRRLPQKAAVSRQGFCFVDGAEMGLWLIDTRVFQSLPAPYFKLQYTDENEAAVGIDGDLYFTLNAQKYGVPLIANFDSWAGYWHREYIGKPDPTETAVEIGDGVA